MSYIKFHSIDNELLPFIVYVRNLLLKLLCTHVCITEFKRICEIEILKQIYIYIHTYLHMYMTIENLRMRKIKL